MHQLPSSLQRWDATTFETSTWNASDARRPLKSKRRDREQLQAHAVKAVERCSLKIFARALDFLCYTFGSKTCRVGMPYLRLNASVTSVNFTIEGPPPGAR